MHLRITLEIAPADNQAWRLPTSRRQGGILWGRRALEQVALNGRGRKRLNSEGDSCRIRGSVGRDIQRGARDMTRLRTSLSSR